MSNNNNSTKVLNYASEIWKTADILRGVGIKQSEWPNYMMPFLALSMIESRIIIEINKLKDSGLTNPEEIREILESEGFGYNDTIIFQDKKLQDIFQNDKTYESDFDTYLSSFDNETIKLLGCKETDGKNYLDLNNWVKKLRAEDIAYDYIKAWSNIDLTELSNHEITDMEEHIKRRWADISADTSGEQYTPSDIFDLISALGVRYIEDMYSEDRSVFNIYDMTCGGGNMLFGVEDNINESLGDKVSISTYGQEINTQLYALAKIESRFRLDSTIYEGNTLINSQVDAKSIDLGVANPPYGVDWKTIKSKIENDETGQYRNYPSTSDGQLLFVQHQINSLKDDGKAIVVLNGSPLFSGDAGSGESEIRKWILDNDYIEGLIQLPTNEFFNTGITTYLWLINKNKPVERKNKIVLINAADMFVKLKKSKGSKTCEIDSVSREKIVELFANCDLENNDNNPENVKVLSKYDFYYNKLQIQLTNVDLEGRSFEDNLPVNSKGVKAKTLKLTNVSSIELEGNVFNLEEFIKNKHLENKESYDESSEEDFVELSLQEICKNHLQPYLKEFESKDIKVVLEDNSYYSFDEEKETITLTSEDSIKELGKGVIDVKASYKKATAKREEFIDITVEVKPDYEKDYEVIPYSPSEEDNRQEIDSFMKKWVERPYEELGNTIGVEVNFNKIFYKPEVLRPLEEIKADLLDSHDKLSQLMQEVFND